MQDRNKKPQGPPNVLFGMFDVPARKRTIRITVAWWVRWYLAGVALAAKATGANPDYDKVREVVMRGVRAKAQ